MLVEMSGQKSGTATMPKTLMVQLDLPKDWRTFRMPRGLQARLQELLDRQDQTGKLTRRERQEANGLVELAEMLTLMKLRVRLAAKQTKS